MLVPMATVNFIEDKEEKKTPILILGKIRNKMLI